MHERVPQAHCQRHQERTFGGDCLSCLIDALRMKLVGYQPTRFEQDLAEAVARYECGIVLAGPREACCFRIDRARGN
jgi:hypothetical protein